MNILLTHGKVCSHTNCQFQRSLTSISNHDTFLQWCQNFVYLVFNVCRLVQLPCKNYQCPRNMDNSVQFLASILSCNQDPYTPMQNGTITLWARGNRPDTDLTMAMAAHALEDWFGEWCQETAHWWQKWHRHFWCDLVLCMWCHRSFTGDVPET